MQLLVVDDDPRVRETVRRALVAEGHSVTLADDGEQGLDLLRAEHGFDGALVDLLMPRLDGLELCRRLRDEGNTIPILIMTASGDPNAQREAIAAGASAFIGKPFTLDDLRAALNSLKNPPAPERTARRGSIIPEPMAPKPKPPPRRPVQAPKRRDTRSSGLPLGRRGWIISASVALAVAVALVASLALRDGNSSISTASVDARLTAAGCSFKTFPNQGRSHVQNVNARIDYNSFPPTSGPHYYQPAPWGFYSEPVDSQVRVVHNLEHGGIVIQWGRRVPRPVVEQLRRLWQESPNGMLLAPLPSLNAKIAVTAWTHLATCQTAPSTALRTFRDAYRTKGPEPFPLSALAPGT